MAKRLKSRINTKIVGATMVTIFSLASVFSGTYAWFAMQNSQTITTGAFEVVNNSGASMGTVQLCKFVYKEESGIVKYFSPSEGTVERYAYSTQNSRFENVRNGDQPAPASYQRFAQVMNMFDPAGFEIYGIRELLCNAVYIIPVTSSSLNTLKVYANILEREEEEEEEGQEQQEGEEIIINVDLSDYVDFDVYTDADIAAADAAHSGNAKYYYPSHIPSSEAEPSDSYTKLFYKIDYLSAQSNKVHKHFYGGSSEKIQIDPGSLSFSSESENIYINVNYAPSQLERYARQLVTEKIVANYDFYFSLEV